MNEQNDKKVAVSGQSSSPRLSIDEQTAVGIDQSVPQRGHRTPSKTLEAAVIRGVPAASPQSDAHMGRSLGQILIVLVVLLVLVNIPINFHGVSLAQIIPEATAIVIYDGMVLKGSGPEIYVLEDHKLRWISSPEAFDYYFRQHNIHFVEDNLLEGFGKGRAIHRLVTCLNSPHIYALEQGQKRLVKDPSSRNQTNPWDEVRLVSCDYLRHLPEGSPVPEDAAPPP
jgi:hypothetical protein